MEVTDHAIAITLTALYLPGSSAARHLNRKRWRMVEDLLRRESANLEAAEKCLRSGGFWLESAQLCIPGALAEAESLVTEKRVLTSADREFPRRWLSRLSLSCPPVFWRSGTLPREPYFSIVGSRQPSRGGWLFAHEAGFEAIVRGFSVASGGAAGCDRGAIRGAVEACSSKGDILGALDIVPYGVTVQRQSTVCRLSLCGPNDLFTAAAAMERNRLLYALSDQTLVAAARLRAGGTWRGAADALRTRLCRVCVREDGSAAARALAALGARPVGTVGEIFAEVSAGDIPESFVSLET